jgi:hypothetical protein
MVIPEIGLALTPISPVIRDETTTKKNPKMNHRADQRDPDGKIDVGAEPAAHCPDAAAEILEAGTKGAHDGGQCPNQGNDAGRRDCSCANVEDEFDSNFAWAHIADELGFGEDGASEAGAEQLDGRNQDQVGQTPAGKEEACDSGPDDVTHPEQLG